MDVEADLLTNDNATESYREFFSNLLDKLEDISQLTRNALTSSSFSISAGKITHRSKAQIRTHVDYRQRFRIHLRELLGIRKGRQIPWSNLDVWLTSRRIMIIGWPVNFPLPGELNFRDLKVTDEPAFMKIRSRKWPKGLRFFFVQYF